MVKKMKKTVLLTVTICMILTATTASAEESLEIYESNFQLSFVTPFGTNGMHSHRTINKISINIFGGYSYGNTGVELGGFYNINTHLTQGVQVAGFVNYSGNADNALQVAGLANIAVKGTVSSQFAGILNIAGNVNGSQFSGIANIATNEVSSQFGGILNIAKKVNGVQIGLINIADEVDGVSIGLISIVKNGGKQEFEISFSEILNTAISFKLGTDHFYTIFSGGIKYIPTSSVEYAYGLGFGTHIDWAKGWGNQIELLAYSVTENGKYFGGMSNLYQFKLTVSKEFAKHFKVFAGPVFNLAVSTYKNPTTGELDNSLAPWSMWKTDFRGTQLESWIGFSVGVRF